MKTLFAILLTVVLGIGLIACSGEKQSEQTPAAEPQMESATTAMPDTAMEMTAVCANCGMTHDKADMMVYETEEGDTLYFCGQDCKDAYMAKMQEETTE